jgi:hypothetical protein
VENMAASDKMPIAPPSLSWLHTSTPHGRLLPSALDELLHPFHRQVFAHLDGGGQGFVLWDGKLETRQTTDALSALISASVLVNST